MARQRRPRPAGGLLLAPAQMLRVLSLLFMLGVIGITVHRNAPWQAPALVADAAAPGGVDDTAEKAPQPVPADGTALNAAGDAPDVEPGEPAEGTPPVATIDDRDPEEAAAFRRQIEAVEDRDWATQIHSVEMPAYSRILNWVQNQSFAQLSARAPQQAVFQQLRQHPNKYRGELLSVELSVRRVMTYDIERPGGAGTTRLYELWGWPTSGRGWFYVVVTPELPPGFPIDADIAQTVRVCGYFFKLQGYQPAKAKPNAPALAAPLIIGRVSWVRTPLVKANPAEQTLSYVILAGGGAIVLGAIGYWFVAARRKKISRPADDIAWPSAAADVSPSEGDSDHEPRAPLRGEFDWLRDD